MSDQKKDRTNRESDSQPGPSNVQDDIAESTTSQHADEPGSTPDPRTPPARQ